MSSALRRLVPVLFVVVASLTACDRQAPDRALSSEPAQQQWQHHVTDYTQGWVGSEMPLRIRFSHPVVDKTRLNQPLDKLVSLEPHHAVIAVFTSDNVLQIRHPEPFAAGQTYRVQLAPASLQNLPAELPPWQIVRERRATFAATPEENAKRPPAETKWDNLFLAGDWTATGLPATLEGAIRSGNRAADLVVRNERVAA